MELSGQRPALKRQRSRRCLSGNRDVPQRLRWQALTEERCQKLLALSKAQLYRCEMALA
ncbi:MAG: hypothetical protein ACLUSS_08295 [Faecalibacterium sp.]